jgi:hypothetical protein
MKAETWVFALCSIFFVLVAPAYWLITGDPTGTTALVMTFLLTTLISFYLGAHARKMAPRPEDRKDGFFPPYSWWPLWCAMCLASMALGVAVGWWLFIIGGVLGAIALSGLIFEFYRGEHAH